MEPIIYKPGAYNTPGVYKGTGGIYKGRGLYNDGAGGVVPPGYEDLGGDVGLQPVCYIEEAGMYWTKEDFKDTYYSYNQYMQFNQGLKNGWRIPSTNDVNKLRNTTFGSNMAKRLMSTEWGGSDNYGFNANPTGYYKNIDANFTDPNYFFIGTSTKTSNNTRFNSLRIRSTSDFGTLEISSVLGDIYNKVRIKVRFCRDA